MAELQEKSQDDFSMAAHEVRMLGAGVRVIHDEAVTFLLYMHNNQSISIQIRYCHYPGHLTRINVIFWVWNLRNWVQKSAKQCNVGE